MLLVVDDDASSRVGTIRLLRALGYEAAGLASGEEALAHMKAHPPRLVILDYAMPGTSGLDVLSAMRADGALRDVPVIFLSAVDDWLPQAAMQAGASAYLSKLSLNAAKLEQELHQLIGPP